MEMVELRLMEGDPFLICQFHCQQLKCVRDKFGNVVEGSPDTIHRVYYFWGLQQVSRGRGRGSGHLRGGKRSREGSLWRRVRARGAANAVGQLQAAVQAQSCPYGARRCFICTWL